MGTKTGKKPSKLASKLLEIRKGLNLSQAEMIREIGGEVTQSQISAFERGTRQPSLVIVLNYARLGKVSMEYLVDDSLDLREKLPTKRTHS